MGNQIDKVIPGLFVGGYLGNDQRERLKENSITHVLAIHDTAEPKYPKEFTYKCIRVADSSYTDLSPYFSECVDFIHDCRVKGGAVFVHWYAIAVFVLAGISRSVTVTVCYLMTVSSLGFEESLTVVQYCREMANPNFGFRMQLRKYGETKLDEERKRIALQYSEKKLSDEDELQTLLKQAREKFGQTADPFPYNPDAFTRKKAD